MSSTIWPKAKFLLSASFLSLLIGLVALYYTVRRTRTNLIVDVTSESNVMDVRTPRKDLSILFQGQDIQKENSNLRILGIRLVNEGDTNILENHFDSRIPWGLRIGGGRLIEARVTGSNSEYLSSNLHPRVTGGDEVDFDKLIFDKGKYVSLELLVLHEKNVEPQVTTVGKIAGMDTIPIRNSFRELDQEGFRTKAFKGPIAVQIVRTIVYFLIGLAAVIAVGIAVAGILSIPSGLRKRSRRKKARYLLREGSPETEKKRLILVDAFIEEGTPGLKRIQAALNDPEILASAVVSRRRLQRIREDARSPVQAISQSNGFTVVEISTPLDLVVETGLVRRNGPKIEVDPDLPRLLKNLIEQVSQFDDKSDDAPKLTKQSADEK